jgi:hypothetical protein
MTGLVIILYLVLIVRNTTYGIDWIFWVACKALGEVREVNSVPRCKAGIVRKFLQYPACGWSTNTYVALKIS